MMFAPDEPTRSPMLDGTTGAVTGNRAMMQRLGRGSVTAFLIYIVGTGLTYLAQLVLARTMGADSYGIYAYVFAWMTVFAYLAALGFDVSLLRLIPAYQSQRAWALVSGVIQYAERRVLLVGLGLFVVGSTVVLMATPERSSELGKSFCIGLVLVPVWALLWIRSSTVRAFGGVASALAPDRVVRDGLLICFIGVAVVSKRWPVDAPFAMLMTVSSSLFGLCLISCFLRRTRPRAVEEAVPAYARSEWCRTTLPLVIIAVSETAMNRTGVVLLGWLGYTKDAGIYALAFNIALMVMVPRMAMNTLFAPAVSALFVRNDRPALQAMITKAALWALCGGACIALPLALFSDPLLAWFGHDFAAAATLVRILLFGQVIAAGAGSQLFIMTMTGNERSAAILIVLSVAANGAATFLLIGVLGPVGAAVANTATLIAWNAGMALFILVKLRIVPTVVAALIARPDVGLR
jgi:O-antigen/teichoic acid export membrane protein